MKRVTLFPYDTLAHRFHAPRYARVDGFVERGRLFLCDARPPLSCSWTSGVRQTKRRRYYPIFTAWHTFMLQDLNVAGDLEGPLTAYNFASNFS